MPSIYELTVFLYEGELAYPKLLEKIRLGLFTTVERAEGHMQAWLVSQDNQFGEPDKVACFILEQVPQDKEPQFLRRRFYDPLGGYHGEINADGLSQPFPGREPETCRFGLGELVQFIYGEHLELGIVAGLPLSPKEVADFGQNWEILGDEDCYLVLLGQDDHAHPRECELFQPTGRIDD